MRIRNFARPLLVLALGALAAGCATGPSGAARNEATATDLLAAFDGVAVKDIVQAGDVAAAAREYDRALFIYTQALELEESADTWVRMGHVYQRLGQKSQAWQAYASALRMQPDNASAHEEIGLLHLGMSQRDAAETHLTRAIALDPKRWRSHNALGIMADVRQEYGAAIGHYEAALGANPDSAMLLNNLGYSHYLAGNLNQAETHFRMAVGIDSEYAPAVANLGLARARRRDYDEAVEILRQTMPKAQAYNDVGFVAYHNGDFEEAAWLLTEAIRISPTYYETARQNLRRVREAMLDQDSPADLADTIRPPVPAAEPAGNEPMPAAGAERVVRPERLNVRGAATSDAPVVATLDRDERVEVMHEQGGWAFIGFWRSRDDGRQTGWVNARYIGTGDAPAARKATVVPAAATSAPAAEPNDLGPGDAVGGATSEIGVAADAVGERLDAMDTTEPRTNVSAPETPGSASAQATALAGPADLPSGTDQERTVDVVADDSPSEMDREAVTGAAPTAAGTGSPPGAQSPPPPEAQAASPADSDATAAEDPAPAQAAAADRQP